MGLLQTIKNEDQDFEWYPTPDTMLEIISSDINSRTTHIPYRYREELIGIMDIGAGDGRALKYFKEHCDELHKFMAIEKSSILSQQWPDYIFPVGCDVMAQSLIDKPTKIIFCNPPYSKFSQWMTKIISEGFFSDCYFVVPKRWVDSKVVTDAIDSREMTTRVLWSGDFLDAERVSRATVDIVCVQPKSNEYGVNSSGIDPFEDWFNSQFKFNESADDVENERETLHSNALIHGKNLIEALEVLYNDEMARLYASYTAITNLEYSTLEDMGIKKDAVQSTLREKIKGLKNKYWKEVFDNLDKVTSRLTTKSRKSMLDKLMNAVNVDFDSSNIYTVLIWVIKNANQYFDTQIVEVFKDLACYKSIKPYKSNQHFNDGTWRSLSDWDIRQGKAGKYTLDYRFVREGNFYTTTYSYGAKERRDNFIKDIATIAHNLGFEQIDLSGMELSKTWEPGEWHEAVFDGGVLFTAKVFMNGNIHLKFDQTFMAKMNVEAGRLLGWVTTREEAEEEFEEEIPPEYWESGFTLDISNVKAITS